MQELPADWPGPGFDPSYFSTQDWSTRSTSWLDAMEEAFAPGNREVVDRAIHDAEAGLRVVINIGAHSLVTFVEEGRYRNLYEEPVVGDGPPKEATTVRQTVDSVVGVGSDTYFAAIALGGAGVRYYGEYCMVIDIRDLDPDPQIFDRDSYDVLLPPLRDHPDLSEIVRLLRGHWSADRTAMVLMKVMPELVHLRRLVTTGTVSEVVLKDQEFIEVHLKPAEAHETNDDYIGPTHIQEVRESPDEVAVAARLYDRETNGARLTDVEHEWLVRREAVERALTSINRRSRVVTQHGRGYQWA